MVNIMGIVIGLIAYLAVTFVASNFILQKEFDVVSATMNLVIVLLSIFIGFKVARMLKLKPSFPLTKQ